MEVKSFVFAVAGAKPTDPSSTTPEILLSFLEHAKSLTVYKEPSTDDLDAVLAGLFQKKTKFHLTFDIYAQNASKAWVWFAAFGAQDATLSSQPTRQGAGKNVLLKIDFSFSSFRILAWEE